MHGSKVGVAAVVGLFAFLCNWESSPMAADGSSSSSVGSEIKCHISYRIREKFVDII